jgi:hypothetical protein
MTTTPLFLSACRHLAQDGSTQRLVETRVQQKEQR